MNCRAETNIGQAYPDGGWPCTRRATETDGCCWQHTSAKRADNNKYPNVSERSE